MCHGNYLRYKLCKNFYGKIWKKLHRTWKYPCLQAFSNFYRSASGLIEGTLSVLLTTYIYYTYVNSVGFEHSNKFFYAPCLTCWALFGSLVPAITVRHVPKCMSYHGAIKLLHIYIYIYIIIKIMHLGTWNRTSCAQMHQLP